MENSPPGPSSPSSSSFSYITRRQRRSPAAAASQPQPRDGSPSRQRLRTESDTSSTAEIELDSLPNPAQDDPTSDSSPSDSESDEEALMLGPASFRGLSEDPDGAIELKSKRRSTRASKRKSSARRTSSSSTPGSDPVEKEPDGEDPLAIIRQVVPETDDPDLPSLTWRALVIGTVFCVIGAAISQLFFYKSNSPSFSSYFVILVTLPLGKWLARRLPDRRIGIGRLSFELNPGPFSIKEHLLVAVLSSSGAASAYASDIINIQELFFHQHMSNTAALTLLLTTQILGFGFAGLVHDLLVKPPAMIFPSTLVTTSLFHTLHNDKSAENRPKLRVFTLVFLAIFAYQFLPALFAPTLSSIAVLCLVNNKNKAFRVLSSGYHGLGFLNFTLDWNAAGTSGPFYQPWWAALNFYGGIAGMMYIVTPIYYFGFNLWESQSFPQVLGSGLYDKDFKAFKVDDVLLPDNTLDREKWQAAKPMLLTPFCESSFTVPVRWPLLL
ncbi:hypothetical protein IE53DRAFT_212756 [Violaceomyces palustris]|uniref:Uncharacterized protein n=1 Tax=Violaceomyces palustris TaxID=1673888 RepID=A0ACD0NQL7_9BASI|nr:hypothetical protein IE53DRAFT_212756 [Violaceomyces palustris]